MYINEPNDNTTLGDWYIDLYEEYLCENKLQLCKKREWNHQPNSNIKKIGYRTEDMKKQKEKECR